MRHVLDLHVRDRYAGSKGAYLPALVYLLGSVVAGFVGVFAGILLAERL
jgi:fluoride ion exporter CrcB/FEX